MARIAKPFSRLRARARSCSIRTAFFLYAAAALGTAIILSFISTLALGAIAEATLPADPYAYSGIYLYDDSQRTLVPAEPLSWYERAAEESAAGDAAPSDGDAREAGGRSGASGDGVVELYVASASYGDARPIAIDDPPAGIEDKILVDLIRVEGEDEPSPSDSLELAALPAYDAVARASRTGDGAARALSDELPANVGGGRPLVSTVGYYVPYPDAPAPYQAIAFVAMASVPVIFAACLVVAGRRFYRARLEGPIVQMDEAARRIAADDLDFTLAPARDDELGRLCGQFETMRAELERSKRELWRAAENRRRVNAAFAHDLRTPLTVVRGQAELIEKMACSDAVRGAARAIGRQAERLCSYADSMRDLDSLETQDIDARPVGLHAWFAETMRDMGELAQSAGIVLVHDCEGLPGRAKVDGMVLSHVAENLIGNAVRHARTCVTVSLAWRDGVLALGVSDDGDGFSPEALAHASEPFWSEDAGGEDGHGRILPTGVGGGHIGLGLYICSVMTVKHGGSLSLRNTGGAGAIAEATFWAPEVKEI